MPQENVELVRKAFESFLARKKEWGSGLLDPEVEWDATELSVLDISGVYRGVDEVRQFWREWLAAWETLRFEYELLDAGERVVMLFDMTMRGRYTGIDVPFGNVAWVFTYRNGLLVHQKLYMSQSEALEAVELSE
jgi:hypothetical protein